MCDTILAMPSATANGAMLFGKNSDRQRNEAQAVEVFPAASFVAGERLRCTYIEIPQARRINRILICRPFWGWGAEMGVNTCGVVIGNEGLIARSPSPEREALTGMDLVRLALERGGTAVESLEIICRLLGQYGQGGNCGHLSPSFYHNSFMIADADEAFVLETVGSEWVVERVDSVRALSNVYSVGDRTERVSSGLNELIRSNGWAGTDPIIYRNALGDRARDHIGQSRGRLERATAALAAARGALSVGDFARLLRDHGPDEDAGCWDPITSKNFGLCIHAGGEDRRGQTTGSLISEVSTETVVHWVTGTAAPCISLFKPVLANLQFNNPEPPLSDRYDGRTLWWRHERLHRQALRGDFAAFLASIASERDDLEAEFRARVRDVLNGGNASEQAWVVSDCWRTANEAEVRWEALLDRAVASRNDDYGRTWASLDARAGVMNPPPNQ